LVNSFISYFCIHRKCNVNIKSSVENAKKISNKDEGLSSIEFTLNGEQTNHPIKIKYNEKANSIKT
jgi:hypothetical protein